MGDDASQPGTAPDPRGYPRTIQGMYHYARDRGLDHDAAGIAAIMFHEKHGLTRGQKIRRGLKRFIWNAAVILVGAVILLAVAGVAVAIRDWDRPGPAAAGSVVRDGAVPWPRIGEIVDGHRFLGGNPSDKASWEIIQADK